MTQWVYLNNIFLISKRTMHHLIFIAVWNIQYSIYKIWKCHSFIFNGTLILLCKFFTCLLPWNIFLSQDVMIYSVYPQKLSLAKITFIKLNAINFFIFLCKSLNYKKCIFFQNLRFVSKLSYIGNMNIFSQIFGY